MISLALLLALAGPATDAEDADLFDRSNLVAWCIVPFDAAHRGPEARAAMLERLGLHRLAWDWRAEHLPEFDEEIAALRRHGIELTAVWFPTTLDDDARFLLETLAKHQIKTQLWVMGGGGPTSTPEEQSARVASEADRIRPIAEAAAEIGCTVALYNHGGWFGEPENQLAIIEALGLPNVGIVYNLHHAHHRLDDFPGLLAMMKPHLLALNLNGMAADGERTGRKILPIGAGDDDLAILRAIVDSGWRGPIGILDHVPEADSEAQLRKNLDGLDRLAGRLRKPSSAP